MWYICQRSYVYNKAIFDSLNKLIHQTIHFYTSTKPLHIMLTSLVFRKSATWKITRVVGWLVGGSRTRWGVGNNIRRDSSDGYQENQCIDSWCVVRMMLYM